MTNYSGTELTTPALLFIQKRQILSDHDWSEQGFYYTTPTIMPKTFTTIKMGTECEDRATKLRGTITHWHMNMAGNITYLFQPKGLNPETGKPVSRIHMPIDRLIVPDGALESTPVPFEILGTEVTDKASGFTGMAISFIRHRNGCFHVDIQPAGVIEKTNSPVDSTEFDIRGCVGPNVPDWTEAELKESERRHPSPIGDEFPSDPFAGKVGD